MSMLFPYRLRPYPQPILALGGRFSRPRPLVQVTVIGPAGDYVESALLDTGADETLLPDTAATLCGIDLTSAPVALAEGAGPGPLRVRQAQVFLRLTDGTELREWPAWVGFAATLRRPLLGFAGCLQFFTATFRGDREHVELTANGLYPGT
jgi:predicted aspartyl protease